MANHFRQTIPIDSLSGLDRRIERLLKRLRSIKRFSNLSGALLRDLKLVMIEGATNAVLHGGSNRKNPAQIRFEAMPKRIQIVIEDKGPGFSLNRALKNRPADDALTGRGLWILKNLVDQVSYRKGRPNRLQLVRRLTRPKKIDAAIELFEQLHQSIQQLKPVKYLYEQFLDFIVDLFNVERASFLIYDRESEVLKVAVSRGISSKLVSKIGVVPGEGIAGYVFKTSRPLLVHNLAAMRKGSPKPRNKGYQSSSFVSVPVIASPMHIGEETIGVLNLTDKRDGSRFTSSEVKLLNLMAGLAASAFRINDLIDTVKAHEGLNKELQIVQEIQNRLLPQDFPKLGDLDLGGLCKLSSRGGGDYYDVVKIQDVLRGIVADVSGHHVGSAITMASFRAVFRSLVFDPNSPAELVRALRWAMHQDLVKLHQFISCWAFEYSKTGALKVCGAGHPPILHYKSRLKKWQHFESQQLPLGLEDDAEPENIRIHLEKKDCLFLYTDGLFDPRMRETGFDKQKFCELVQGNLNLSSQKLAEKILEEVAPHQMALRSPDDIALLVFRRN